jgi:hypothetical protein
MSVVAIAISWWVRFCLSSRKPMASATISIDWLKPSPSSLSIGLSLASSGGLPKSITSRTTFSA